jgi:hypothetical protein
MLFIERPDDGRPDLEGHEVTDGTGGAWRPTTWERTSNWVEPHEVD